MKILILHLSDTHIISGNDVNPKRINRLVDSLNILNKFDECIIVYSGDLANSGAENEYSHVERFLGSIISKIKNTYLHGKIINTLIVPGNHDVEFRDMKRDRNDIIELYNSKEIENHVMSELKLLDKFYKFANRNRCFLNDQILDKKILDFNGYQIGVNLINSAIFCDKKDDKGIHFISDKYIDMIYDYSNLDVIISISHYSHEWYNQDCKNKLDKALFSNSSIIFLGHEHVDSNKCVSVGVGNKAKTVDISAGGIFNDHKNPNLSEYIAKVIDTNDNTLETYSFSWTKDFYKHSFISKNNIHKISSRSEKMEPSSDFLKNFLIDTKHTLTNNCLDYFTFPRLIGSGSEGYNDDYELCESDKLLNEIENKKRIVLVGNENSGKTTLLKHLYIKLLDTKIPLYFEVEDVKNKNTSKIIKSAFEEQYSEDPIDFYKFQQVPSMHKVAIIDDINYVKLSFFNSLIENLSMEFDYIIMSSNIEWDLDIMDKVKKLLISKDKFSKYKIQPFYSDKRKELIKLICCAICKNEDVDIEESVITINNFIKNQLSVFDLSPDFIIQYIIYYFRGMQTSNDKNGSIFSKVFEINIISSIKNNISGISVDRALIVLDNIAHHIHFNKRYPLSYIELEGLIKEYNSKFRQSIKTKTFLEELKNAKILKDSGENFEIKFVNKNILAFFVAREIIKKYKNEDDSEGLNYVLNNICFGINGDIVLFISYLESNTKLLKAIYNNANNYLSSWEEYSIDKGNVKFLDKLTSDIKIIPPTKKDKEYEDEMETKSEKEDHKDEIIETIDIYDYNEADSDLFINKLIKALKHTEMMAKILPNFEYMLNDDDIAFFVDAIYRFPNKIIYLWTKFIDDNLSQLIKDVKEMQLEIENETEVKKLSDDDVIKIFERMSISTIFNVYNGFTKFATDKNTIKALNSFNLDGNTNYIIQNIMMLESINELEDFIKRADALHLSKNKRVTDILLGQTVRKSLIDHENMPHGLKQHLLDKYFNKQEKLKMLISGETHKK